MIRSADGDVVMVTVFRSGPWDSLADRHRLTVITIATPTKLHVSVTLMTACHITLYSTTMVGVNAEFPSKAPSGAEGGTPTLSRSALAWEELSQQLSQLSSDMAHLRLHTSREFEVARFRQWSFPSHSLAPTPRLSDMSHDFWDLEVVDQARDMSHFRAGLCAAPTEDLLVSQLFNYC